MNGPRIWEVLATGQADSTALTSSVAQTSILPAAAKITIPSQYIDFLGRSFRVSLRGRISTLNPTPGTFTIAFRMGSVDAFTSSTLALNTTAAKTNVAFLADLLCTVRVIGASAQVIGQWRVESEAFALATTGSMAVYGPGSAPAVGTAFDATASQTIDVTGQWSVNSASNSILIHQYLVEAA